MLQVLKIFKIDSKLYHLKYVVIATKVMIIKNINICKGTINGAIAVVTSLIFYDNEIITNIIIKVINTNESLIWNKQTLQHKYTYEAYYYKTSFPIVLTYVITIHKAQGAKITSKVLIHVRESFTVGLTYVMLSRLTNHANLTIRGSLKPLDFICIDQC